MTPEQLKASILQYAIQGKLVEQRPEEGTAEELYQQIQEEKARLVKEGKIKREKKCSEITETEIPFDIPCNWKWVRLSDITKQVSDGTHRTPQYVENGIPFISVKDITKGHIDLSDVKHISEEEHRQLIMRCKPEMNDILICRIGTLGKAVKVHIDEEFSIFVSLGLIKLIERRISDYITMVINSGYGFAWIQSVKVGGGTHTFKINLEDLRSFLIPLPPLAEQHRIVAKIEELLPLADRYAVAYEKLEQFNVKFPEDMKKSILQYAIQGKLVEQRPEEGTAEELYKQIQDEKARLVKEGKIKKEKPLAAISEEEIPFDIPESWKWCRLSEVIDVRDGTHDSPKYVPEGIPLVTSKNLSNGTIDYGNIKYITQADADKINERSAVDDGDILFAMIGSIGNPVLVKKDREFCIKNMALFKRYTDTDIDMNYMYWFFYFVQYSLKAEASGGVQSFISLTRFREYPFPLPPYEEQKRIAKRIEEVLPLCGRLSER